MECAVCYETCPGLKLVCGHAFCRGCVKQWIMKGTGAGCPMCRRPVYFKGYYKKAAEWEEEAWNNKVDAVVGECIDAECERFLNRAQTFKHPMVKQANSMYAMYEFTDIQKTARVLKANEVHEDDIEMCLHEGVYLSDHHLNKKNQYRDKPREMPKLKNRPRDQRPKGPLR